MLVVEWVAEEGKTCRGKPEFVLFCFVKTRTEAVGGFAVHNLQKEIVLIDSSLSSPISLGAGRKTAVIMLYLSFTMNRLLLHLTSPSLYCICFNLLQNFILSSIIFAAFLQPNDKEDHYNY